MNQAQNIQPVLTKDFLVEAHLDAIHGLALAWTRDRDRAGDLVQRTFLKAFHKLDQLQSPDSAKAWMITILRHELIRDFRDRARWEPFEDEVDIREESENPLDAEMLESLPAAIESLPLSHRDILLLRFQQDLSYESIAAVMEVPVGTVMSRLYRAKSRLRRIMLEMTRDNQGIAK